MTNYSLHLLDNLFKLHDDLKNKTYYHGGYYAFKINDPKPREIHKAKVRDRLVHHALHRVLNPYFNRKFIFDSYSCRRKKGTHAAIYRLQRFYWKISKNNTRTVWVLKCDIRKFFANIDHKILMKILEKHIADKDALLLMRQIIESFHTKKKLGVGLPLGNLTSQLFINIYMNEFDQHVKRWIKVRFYLRYADDFILMSTKKTELLKWLKEMKEFLRDELKLELHPKKIQIRTFNSGVDFLGWVSFSNHRVLRTSTKKRMVKKLRQSPKLETKQSYLGLLKHGNTETIKTKLKM